MKFRIILLALLAVAIGCSKSNPNTPTEPDPDIPTVSPDSTLVSLRTSLDFTAEPLSKAGSQDDLYGIRVYQLSKSGPLPVAYGTFDNLNTAIVKLAKAYKYGIDVTYIQNGKNLVHKYSGGYYGVPFDNEIHANHPPLNQMTYLKNVDDQVYPLSSGAVQEAGITNYGIEYNNWSSVKRYQGVAVCDPSKQESVDIKLYLQMIGFRISISDFDSGTVTLCGQYGHKYRATPNTNKEGLIDVVVCLESMPSVSEEVYLWTQEGVDVIDHILSKERNQTVMLSYSDNDGNITNLYMNTNFRAKRNTRYTMSFSLSDAIRNGGITATTVDEGNMTEEGFQF